LTEILRANTWGATLEEARRRTLEENRVHEDWGVLEGQRGGIKGYSPLRRRCANCGEAMAGDNPAQEAKKGPGWGTNSQADGGENYVNYLLTTRSQKQFKT